MVTGTSESGLAILICRALTDTVFPLTYETPDAIATHKKET